MPIDIGPRVRHATAHDAYIAAISQINKVVELYNRNKDQQASAILDELISAQTQYTDGETYSVKSLCNIAQQIKTERPEVAFACLSRALTFSYGTDAVAYLQMGYLCLELRKYDEAIRCFNFAVDRSSGELRDQARLELIRVLVRKGHYQAAMGEYLAIQDILKRPAELSGLGTLYRRMGMLQEAGAVYRHCLSVDGMRHTALAGLAEIDRQGGNVNRAIVRYNGILNGDLILDLTARKVYRTARSQLFRFTQQFAKAERELAELLAEFPRDESVHREFGKVLALQGDLRAADHFEIARQIRQGREAIWRDVGTFVFKALALGNTDVGVNLRIYDEVAPEDRGLASCLRAYEMLRESQFQAAEAALSDIKFVDHERAEHHQEHEVNAQTDDPRRGIAKGLQEREDVPIEPGAFVIEFGLGGGGRRRLLFGRGESRDSARGFPCRLDSRGLHGGSSVVPLDMIGTRSALTVPAIVTT
jgi:tetratricopeptide (TPR) repeat protein